MIKYVNILACDLCGEKIVLDEHVSEIDLILWAQRHGWDVDHKPSKPFRFEAPNHYCPNCKVPVKLAKAMEDAK